jgi:hypothetical protein
MKLKKTLNKHKKALRKKKNVVAVGIGQKWTNGKNTGKDAILIFVTEKKNERDLSLEDKIPKTIDGTQTDVVGRTGQIKAQDVYTSKIRPLKPGYSCGHTKVTAGTLGSWFLDKDGDIVGLSNNHVLANENHTSARAVIVQPGTYDNSNWMPNRVGKLKSHIKLRKYNNKQDSAIFQPFKTLGIDPSLPIIGTVKGFNYNLQVGDPVQKAGRTTGYTSGNVIAMNATVWVEYNNGDFEFNDQIISNYMSAGGDSGSLLCDMNGNAAGLLFAGSDTVTIYNKIIYPKNAYGLQIYNPVNESLHHTVLIDGVETIFNLAKVDDVGALVSQLKQLASTGKTVDLTITYQVSLNS